MNKEHNYKGFTIRKEEIPSLGGWVLGGRHYKEGGVQTNWVIYKDGKPIFKHCVIERLKYAKDEVDDFIKRK